MAPTWRAERPGGGRELGGLVEVLKPGLPGRLAGAARPQQRVRCAALHGFAKITEGLGDGRASDAQRPPRELPRAHEIVIDVHG